MYAFFKRAVSIVFILAFNTGSSQTPTKELNIREVGWTLFIPTDSKFLNVAEYDTIQQRAINAMNQSYGITADDFKDVKLLFNIRQGQYNIFGSTINLFDSTLGMTWQESYAASKYMVIELMNQQGPELKLVDTASAPEVIDGIRFESFFLTTFYPSQNLTMKTYWFYRKHGNYDFSINISYTDDSIGKKYLDILRNSKFNREGFH